MNEKCMSYCKGLVKDFLINHPYLKTEHEDLLQTAYEGWLIGEQTFDETKGTKGAHCHKNVEYILGKYLRSKIKTFPPKVVEEDSPYWDLGDPYTIDELPDTSQPSIEEQYDLKDILDKVELTNREQEVLDVWLESGDHAVTSRKLGVSEAAVKQRMASVIRKAKELTDE